MGRRVGVLALQGGFQAHERILTTLGASVSEVRVPAELDGLQALVLPGGESTTMMLGIEREGLAKPLHALCTSGIPVLATCAGMIILDSAHLGVMDLCTERNAFGRQQHSFEADVDVLGLAGGPLRGVFIRAPWITSHGPSATVIAEHAGRGIAARQGQITATAFHPELAGDARLHAQLLG